MVQSFLLCIIKENIVTNPPSPIIGEMLRKRSIGMMRRIKEVKPDRKCPEAGRKWEEVSGQPQPVRSYCAVCSTTPNHTLVFTTGV
ncbi:hypothetical protein J6590_085181 [Homalodisca vitripennis]|nr:hypothetical protein J6590_085181 [Homalodisca vitripennis]